MRAQNQSHLPFTYQTILTRQPAAENVPQKSIHKITTTKACGAQQIS